MNRATPVEMRKALEVVEIYRKFGVRFVAMPVYNNEENDKMVVQAMERLEEICQLIESNEE